MNELQKGFLRTAIICFAATFALLCFWSAARDIHYFAENLVAYFEFSLISALFWGVWDFLGGAREHD